MARRSRINNDFYNDLDWHEEKEHPIALLRAENRLRNPWIAEVIQKRLGPSKVLDIGCGAGFLTNFLAEEGHEVHGIDLSAPSLQIAKQNDLTQKVQYQVASAYSLPYPDASFDAVTAMDLLEHVEEPQKVIAEAARLLRPGALFFFHTFNRNPLSYLIIIKGVEWCVRNTPKNMHVYPLFIKPKELQIMCENNQLNVENIQGVRPDFKRGSFWKMVATRQVPEDFRFIFTPSLMTGYCGYSQRNF